MAAVPDRFDLFRDATPYYGAPLLEIRDRVPTLYSLSVRRIFSSKIDFVGAADVPTVIKSRLEYLKKYESYPGPRVMKCSNCKKFYTHQKRFLTHDCSLNTIENSWFCTSLYYLSVCSVSPFSSVKFANWFTIKCILVHLIDCVTFLCVRVWMGGAVGLHVHMHAQTINEESTVLIL